MAGTITHLVIADMLLKTMPEDILSCIHNRALFYCGNLAPDAIMAREGYVREMKKHTHFKDEFQRMNLQSLRISDFTEAGLRISQDIFLWIITAIMSCISAM